MISELLKLFDEHGAIAVMLAVVAGYHFWWTKAYRKERDAVRQEHIEERKEWRENSQTLQDKTTDVVRDNNEALRELTKVIAEGNNPRKKRRKKPRK